MKELFVIAGIFILVVFAVFGMLDVAYLSVTDVREFSGIVKECRENGRLQSKGARISCAVEFAQ